MLFFLPFERGFEPLSTLIDLERASHRDGTGGAYSVLRSGFHFNLGPVPSVLLTYHSLRFAFCIGRRLGMLCFEV